MLATAQRMTTTKGESFESNLTNEEAIAIVASMTWSGFAISLVQQCRTRGLSANQWVWVHKLAVDQRARMEQPKPATVVFARIGELFSHALSTGHKTPRITLDMEQGRIRINVAGPHSRNPGAIHVTDGGGYGSNVYYGRIDTDGTFAPRHNTPEWVIETLHRLNDQTLDFVVKYGQRTGNCCFCNRELTTTESVTAGYGPICAVTYGLPWG